MGCCRGCEGGNGRLMLEGGGVHLLTILTNTLDDDGRNPFAIIWDNR